MNPEVGAGSIATHSTSVPWSKFGVGILEYEQELLDAYEAHSWLNTIHVHTGSQGCSLEQHAAAIRRVLDFTSEVNHRAATTAQSSAEKAQIQCVNIGGGLPVNFASETHMPLFQDYSDLLQSMCPELFTGQYHVVTEHGRRYWSKAGFALSRVEYTKHAGGRQIALQHCGADLAVRSVYHPDSWPLRISVFDPQGQLLGSNVSSTNTHDSSVSEGSETELDWEVTDVAGPCCIAGDIVAHRVLLPRLQPGYWVALHDVGGYYHSSWSYYNSRQAPALFSVSGDGKDADQVMCFKPAPTIQDTLHFFS